MTDERACDVALAEWVAQRAQMAPAQRRPPVSGSFRDGFAAGLAHARRWHPLTSAPETWPEEGQLVAVVDAARGWADPNANADALFWNARAARQGWTHWHPLPPPPKEPRE